MIPRPVALFPFCRNTANSLWKIVRITSALALPAPTDGADASAPASAPPGTASPSVAHSADLDEGLGYLRAHKLADSLDLLNRTLSKGTALVLDLRYATAADEDTSALAAAFARRTGSAPLFVLVSPRTPPELTPALLKLPRHTLLVGVAEALPTPQVVVAQPADADRRAYDAHDHGVALDALISGKIEKERFDEAELVKEFQNGNPNAAPPPTPDPTKRAPEKAPVLTDRVLQRAVHLHRTLAALKRA